MSTDFRGLVTDKNRGAARGRRSEGVGELVAHHVSARKIDPVVTLRLQKEARLRLPAFALVFGPMRADEKPGDVPTMLDREPCETGVHVVDGVAGDDAATHRRLVRGNEDLRSSRRESAQRLQGSGNDLHLGPRLDVVGTVADQNTITVEKDRL